MARKHLEMYSKYPEKKETINSLPLVHKYTFFVAYRLFLSINHDDDPEQYTARFEKPFHLVIAGVFAVHINFPRITFNRAIRASKMIRN